MPAPDDIEFIYVGDPMCSWCWGFAPVLDAMTRRYDIPMSTVVGGLRPGPSAEPLDEITRRTLAEHWDHVEQASGQPFDRRALDRPGWIYDTELGAIGVVTMRSMAESDTFRFFKRLQRAYYAENIDITDAGAYPDLLDGFDVDRDTFMKNLASEDMKALAWKDFETARRMSISGFPSLLLRIDDQHLIVTRGYLGWDSLEPALTGWLREQYGDDADTLILAGSTSASG
jgi:putative protein-disulfide isomerase